MTSNVEALDLPTLEDTALDGAAAIAEAVQEDDADAFEQRLRAADLPASSTRADFLDDALRLFARLRGRRLVADLGVFPVEVNWLGFHVPPGGSGQLKLAATQQGKSSVQLKLMGLGGGTRRNISFAAEHDFGARKECFYLGQKLEVRVRTFAEGGAKEANALQVDIENTLDRYLRRLPACPLCFDSPAGKPPLAKATGQGWDLTGDMQGITETIKYELEEALELEVGLEIPLLQSTLKPAAEMSRVIKSVCSASYDFPGGAQFSSYQLVGKRVDLPFWGKS